MVNGKRSVEAEMEAHTHEQGLRVHHLANLGGLVAIAGLDLEPPDFLLGALMSVAEEAAALSAEQRARVADVGRRKLEERAGAKRAWRSWRRSRNLHSLLLSGAQLERLIEALGGEPPENPGNLIAALTALLKESEDAPA